MLNVQACPVKVYNVMLNVQGRPVKVYNAMLNVQGRPVKVYRDFSGYFDHKKLQEWVRRHASRVVIIQLLCDF